VTTLLWYRLEWEGEDQPRYAHIRVHGCMGEVSPETRVRLLEYMRGRYPLADVSFAYMEEV